VGQRAHLTVVVALLVAVAGCGTSSEQSAQPSASSTTAAPSSSAPATPAPAPSTSAVPFPADTSPDGGDADPQGVVPSFRLTGLELTAEDGFDRLVVQLDGAGVPEWQVGYGPPENDNGAPVTMAGDSFLHLTMYVGTEAAPPVPSVSGSGLIAEARDVGLFEGIQDVLIGVRGGPLPFRAFTMTEPGRIVIDVRPAG
jgi:hypothetical protein